jgi:hypothetical protein
MDTTQAAAQKCADLANAVEPGGYGPKCFTEEVGTPAQIAFCRYVEHIHETHTKVFDLLDEMDELYECAGAAMSEIKTLLRANLLPDPKPTLLEQFKAECSLPPVTDGFWHGAALFADWIAKREVKP